MSNKKVKPENGSTPRNLNCQSETRTVGNPDLTVLSIVDSLDSFTGKCVCFSPGSKPMYKSCMVFYMYVGFDEISSEIKSSAVYNLDTVCKDLPAIHIPRKFGSKYRIRLVWQSTIIVALLYYNNTIYHVRMPLLYWVKTCMGMSPTSDETSDEDIHTTQWQTQGWTPGLDSPTPFVRVIVNKYIVSISSCNRIKYLINRITLTPN